MQPSSRQDDPYFQVASLAGHERTSPRFELIRRAERLEEAVWRGVISAAPPAKAAELGLRAVAVADGVALIASEVPTLLYNRAFGFGLDRPVTMDEIDAAIALYDRRVPFSIQPAPESRPPNVSAWLEARGLPSYFNWVCWVRETREAAAAPTERRIDAVGPERAGLFADLVSRVFAEPPEVGPWFMHTVGRAGWTHYIGYEQDRPVALASLFVQSGMGWLGWGGTLEAHRGRGWQSAMIARRLADAREQDCEWVTTETADDLPDRPNASFRNMARAGFQLLHRRPSHAFFPKDHAPADD